MNNVELLIESLLKINLEKLNDDMEDYGKFERMRQTWSGDGSEKFNNRHVYDVLQEKGYLNKRYVKELVNYLDKNNSDDVKESLEYKTYINYLQSFVMDFDNKYMNDLTTKFEAISKHIKKLKDTSKKMDGRKKIVEEIIKKTNEFTEVVNKLWLSANKNTNILKRASILEDWMYGENSFYKKKAQEVLKKYSKIYDEYLKIKPKDFDNFKEEYKKLGSNSKRSLLRVNGLLDGLSVDVFGKNNKYSKIISQLGGIMFENI